MQDTAARQFSEKMVEEKSLSIQAKQDTWANGEKGVQPKLDGPES